LFFYSDSAFARISYSTPLPSRGIRAFTMHFSPAGLDRRELVVFRTGNLNYSWGAYVAQLMQIGEVGGIVAIIYAILIARTWTTRLIGLFIWWFNGDGRVRNRASG